MLSILAGSDPGSDACLTLIFNPRGSTYFSLPTKSDWLDEPITLPLFWSLNSQLLYEIILVPLNSGLNNFRV